MKETGGTLVVLVGFVLLVAGLKGTLADVWHAVWKTGESSSATPATSASPPMQTIDLTGGSPYATPIQIPQNPTGVRIQGRVFIPNTPGSGVSL